MPENILHELDIRAGLTHSCREHMPKAVAAEIWEKHFRALALLKLCVIAVTYRPLDRSVQGALIIQLSQSSGLVVGSC